MNQLELNHRLLWSHCLSSPLRGQDSQVRVADACCGINSQNFQESLASFWARIDGFTNGDVLSELRPGGSLVRTWAIRSTMHTIPSKEYYAYVLGGAGERMLNWIDSMAKKRGYPERKVRRSRLYEPVLEEMKGKALTGEEVKARVYEKAGKLGVDDALAGLGDEIVEVDVKGSRQQYFSLARDIDRDTVPPPTALVLPKYDSLLMALKDKSRIMDMRLYKRVFGALGMVRPTVLVNGFVAAIWRKVAKKNGTSIEVHAFKKVSNSDKQAVEERFSDYGKYAGLEVSVSWVRGKWVHMPSR